MKIGLYIDKNYTYMCGPLKVYLNLKKGLERLGHEVCTNASGNLTGCLHHSSEALTLPGNTLMGPNLFLWPKDIPEYFYKYKNFAIPSDWVAPIYTNTPLYNGHRIYTWAVGIDTDLFKINRSPTVDCLIYYKNRSITELSMLEVLLSKLKQTYILVEYGKYQENNYIDLMKNCGYAVLLTNTESQGIGYMEMLSSNLPCFVFNKNKYHEYDATSVPYFDSRCGIVSSFDKDFESDFKIFINNISRYAPAEYIEENHTLEISARNYLSILERCI
jgi:hypothetical protein